MLAASTFGMISRLASAVRRESGNSRSRIVFDSAASPRISPSTASSGSRAWISASASRIFTRRRRVGAAEARVRQQRDARRHAEAPHLLGGEQRHLGDLLGARVAVDVGVADEELPPGQHQHLHRGQRLRAVAQADHVAHVAQVLARSCRPCRTASRRRRPGAPASRAISVARLRISARACGARHALAPRRARSTRRPQSP